MLSLEQILQLEKERNRAFKRLLDSCDRVPLDRKGIKRAARYYKEKNEEYTKAYFQYKREHK
jgi:hypothetical protein